MAENIGRYEVIKELGRGGMATVYLAIDPSFHRQVAIKVLPRQFTHDPKFLSRFDHEARIIATLEDPAIVPVYDFGEQDNAPFLVMRYMAGGSLLKRIAGKPLSLTQIVTIFDRLAPALDAAHQKGIIHRDIKPDNILFDDAERSYLADFGIARMAEATHTMTVVGTPAYMSPEQVRGEQKLDWRSDLYALGVMLFEMLSGQPPYEAETPSGQMFKHVMEPVPDLLAINPALPPQAQNIIDQAMAKDRAERYQSAREMATAVRGLLGFDGTAAMTPPASTSSASGRASSESTLTPSASTPSASTGSASGGVGAVSGGVGAVSGGVGAASEELGAVSGQAGTAGAKTVVDTPPEMVGDYGSTAEGVPGDDERPVDDKPEEVRSTGSGQKRSGSSRVPAWVWWVGAAVVLILIVFGIREAFIPGEGVNESGQDGRDVPAVMVSTELPSKTAESPTLTPVNTRAVPTEENDQPLAGSAPGSAAGMACNDALGCVEIGPGDPLWLASSLVISGPNSDLGQDAQHGLELAIDFREQLLGHTIELQAEDDGCSAEGGQMSATKIVSNPQIVAMIGTSCSGAAVPAAKIISDAGYVMVSPSNTSPAMTDPEQAFQEGYLRTSTNDLVQGRVMAEFAFNELGVTKAAVIHDGDPYTKGLAEAFVASFNNQGGEVVAVETTAPDAADVNLLLATIAIDKPDLIFYPVYIPLGSLITNTAREIQGLDGVILAAADGIQSPSFLENTADTSEGMYTSGPDLSFDNDFYLDEFLPAYQAKYGTEPTAPFHAHAFDAANMVMDAVEEVAQQGSDGTLLIGRQALRDALYATKEMEGITGSISCDVYGDCAVGQIAVSQVQENEFVKFWSSEEMVAARGCVNDIMVPYVWSDERLADGCKTTDVQLEGGEEVRILSDQPVAQGGTCGPGRFIKVQSISNDTLEGWVHEGVIDLITVGESCGQ